MKIKTSSWGLNETNVSARHTGHEGVTSIDVIGHTDDSTGQRIIIISNRIVAGPGSRSLRELFESSISGRGGGGGAPEDIRRSVFVCVLNRESSWLIHYWVVDVVWQKVRVSEFSAISDGFNWVLFWIASMTMKTPNGNGTVAIANAFSGCFRVWLRNCNI